jgi:molybdate transport system substrate-binding protein
MMELILQELKHQEWRRPQYNTFVIVMLILLMSYTMLGCDKTDEEKELLIGAAASLKPVMEELQTLYSDANPEINLTFTFAGSGALEQQIREGAPIDVFISAAEKQMDALSEDNLLLEDTRVDLLENKLVLIVPGNSTLEIAGFDEIIKAPQIALGDPASVPVGQYAQEVFENLGITEEVNSKATYGKDVTEVLAWVSSGNADAGVVYSTDAVFSEQVTIVVYATEDSHKKVIYPAAAVKGSDKAAESFLGFLETKDAKDLFTKYGFGVIDN